MSRTSGLIAYGVASRCSNQIVAPGLVKANRFNDNAWPAYQHQDPFIQVNNKPGWQKSLGNKPPVTWLLISNWKFDWTETSLWHSAKTYCFGNHMYGQSISKHHVFSCPPQIFHNFTQIVFITHSSQLVKNERCRHDSSVFWQTRGFYGLSPLGRFFSICFGPIPWGISFVYDY